MKKIFLFLMLSTICFMTIGCASSSKEVTELQNKVDELQAQVTALEDQNKELAVEILKYKAVDALTDVATSTLAGSDKDEIKNEPEKPKVNQISKEEAIAQQKVVVVSTKLLVQSDTYKNLYPDLMSAIVKNNTEDTAKNITIAYLAYDENGYPLIIKGNMDFGEGAYDTSANASGINLAPGATFGEKNGFSLEEAHKVKYILSCVKSANFFNSGEWENPYYNYWIDEYKEKPISVDTLKEMYK